MFVQSQGSIQNKYMKINFTLVDLIFRSSFIGQLLFLIYKVPQNCIPTIIYRDDLQTSLNEKQKSISTQILSILHTYQSSQILSIRFQRKVFKNSSLSLIYNFQSYPIVSVNTTKLLGELNGEIKFYCLKESIFCIKQSISTQKKKSNKFNSLDGISNFMQNGESKIGQIHKKY